jgi:hypothetical protein
LKPSIRRRLLPFLCMIAFTVKSGGDPLPQSPLDFTQGLQGTFNADWEGVAGRTYFMQFSMDLESWQYAPFMDFGDGGHHRGIDSDAVMLFTRLSYCDYPGINSLDDAMNADFDGDAFPNAFEVFYGFELGPFLADSESALLQHIAAQPEAPAAFELHTPLQ